MTLTADYPNRRWFIRTETILRAVMTIMIAVGSISIVEPSPYEFVFFVLVPIVFLGHLVITRVTLVLFFMAALFLFAEVLALTPYFQDRAIPGSADASTSASLYTLQTIYVFFSMIMFAIIFTRHTASRVRLALVAYTISAVFAACYGLGSFWKIPGFVDGALAEYGRTSGPFKDPNVLGSYCVMGVLFLLQVIMIGRPLSRIVALTVLAPTLYGGIFLPLSRGAWGAMVVSSVYLIAVTFITADNRKMRAGVLVSVLGIILLIVAAGSWIAANDELRDRVTDRAKVEQDYDGGATGRFGNQKRSIAMLMERPLGFGPHRFALTFDLDPHNSYVGAFASAGWLGGIMFMMLFATTGFLAIKQSVTRTPWMRSAQVVCPAMLTVLMQAFQIDVDHWRFIYIMIGAVWGMEAARHLALEESFRWGQGPRRPRPRNDRGPDPIARRLDYGSTFRSGEITRGQAPEGKAPARTTGENG